MLLCVRRLRWWLWWEWGEKEREEGGWGVGEGVYIGGGCWGIM